ncbi:hypothetical protein VCHENC01_5056 [Vibrio harveyi]|nr:hypothetical protein VCHENC01_5056 [Vibrio harveyi]
MLSSARMTWFVDAADTISIVGTLDLSNPIAIVGISLT